MKTKMLVLGVLLAGLVPMILAQQIQEAPPKIVLEADYAIFRTDAAHKAYIEIPYAVRGESLVFASSGPDSIMAELLMRVTISGADSLWVADMWRTPYRLPAVDRNAGQRVVNMIRFPIQTGTQTVRLYARDLHAAEISDSLVFTVEIPAISGDELSLSDILLASSITSEQQVTDPAFHKNSMRVIPNPSAIFGVEHPMLFYYLEIYNLQKNLPASTYRTKAYVAHENGEPVPSLKPRIQTKPAMASTVEVSGVNVSGLSSGTYYLHFELLDAGDAVLKSLVKKLYIYNQQQEAVSSNPVIAVESGFFATLTDQQIEQELGHVRYLYNEAERLIVEKLSNARGKREFLAQFWSRFARESTDSWQQFREMYLQRVDYANKNFKSFARQGWMTDRGRVYLLYNKPDDVERFPSSNETKPYEVWSYNGIEGGVEFIFGDRTGFREYQLLHSTKVGEIRNEGWRSLIESR